MSELGMTEVGVAGLLVLAILDKVLGFLRARNGHREHARGIRLTPADFSAEWDEMLRIMRTVDKHYPERDETLRLVRELHTALIESRRRSR